MKCQTCNTENREGAKFCMNCGAALLHVCSQCGTMLPPSARFCDACGTPVAARLRAVLEDAAPDARPPNGVEGVADRLQRLVPKELAGRLRASGGRMAGERRMVTILFCDVTGSTAMAETLDPEVVMEIMDGAFDVLIEPVTRYEGTVARLMGDAVLAFFGAPIAHEDDPERACRAALDIIAGAQRYAQQLKTERGIEGFAVRVGINTGLVVVGEVGSDLRVEYTAMGDAVNVAARLEEIAEPGTVVISEDTHRLVASLFDTEAVGSVPIQGRVDPVLVFRVLAPRARARRREEDTGMPPPLLGREAERQILEAAVERLRAGVGGIVTLLGEAGIGKSRLVAELRKAHPPQVQASRPVSTPSPGSTSLQWVEGRCVSYGTSIAYRLWLDALRELLGLGLDDPLDQVRHALDSAVAEWCPDAFDEIHPYLARLMSLPPRSEAEAEAADLEGEPLKRRTFQAVEKVLECAAEDCPLVLVCEDIHWADPTSLELLERVLGLTDRCSLLVICVFRPRAGHGSWELRETAARLYHHRHTDLWLEPLSAAASESLVDALLQASAPGAETAEGLPQTLRWRILLRAEGNPFHVEEIVRSLIDSGAILPDEENGRWRITQEVTDIPIPETVQGILTARIDRLEDRSRRLLQMASVIGRIFPFRVLEEVAMSGADGWTEGDLEEHLLTLQREELIRERARLPAVEYIFKHELTREAAYRGLLRKERRLIHGLVAESLERLFLEQTEEQVGLLAHHWERAAVAEKAIEYLLRAGDQARMVYAHEEAIDYYQRALAFLREHGEGRQTAGTLMKLGLVHTAAFHPQRAREAYEEGFALWQPGWPTEALPELGMPPGVLRFALEEPPTLDPGRAGDDTSMFIVGQLFEALVEVDQDYNVLPGMAERWDVDQQATRYVFRLRDGLQWNDGTPVTAHDFEYAWKRNLDPVTGSPVAHLLYVIENARAFGTGEMGDSDQVGVTAVDDRILEVRLEAPTGYFLYLMAHPVAFPLPRGPVQAHGTAWIEPQNLVSNGPYSLVAWQRGEKLVLEKNQSYRGPFPGNVHRVECPLFTDYDPMLKAYAVDDLDVVSLINSDPGTVARARAAHGDELRFSPQLSTVYLAFLVDREPFDDVRVRQAFVHAVDRERLVRETWGEQYRPATGGFVPPGMPGHSGGLGLDYDPEAARQLLVDAGYPDGRGFPGVNWIYYGGSEPDPMVLFVQEAWLKALGVHVDALGVGVEALLEPRPPTGLVTSGWRADYPDPDHMLRATFHSTEGLNLPDWHNPAFDDLVEEAAEVTDQPRRMALYREADRILVAEETVVMPLGYARGRILAKPWVSVPRVPPAMVRLKHVACSVGRYEERQE